MLCPDTPNLDAMLLRCRRPEDAFGWGMLAAEPPADGLAWVSEGFPAATDCRGLRQPCSFGGTCFSKAGDEDYFELDARAPPQEEKDWRGASGMPIFVGRRILGVARQVPRRFGAARLHATPAWKLLADEKFRAALGYDERQVPLSKARRALARLLATGGRGLSALALALDCEAELAGVTDPVAQADWLAGRLLGTDIRCAIPALRKAHRSVLAEAGPQEAEPLVAAARLVIPALFDQGVVLHTKGLQTVGLVPLPAGTHTVAELIMAGVDGRAALFRPRASEDDQPAGVLNLPMHPEQGIGADPSAALARHLWPKLDPGRDALRGLRTLIDDYLLGAFSRTEPGTQTRTREQRIQLTADLLEARRQDNDQTFYMVLPLPDDPAERQPIEALVAELKRDYRAIAFLGLDPAFTQQRADHSLCDPLCRMLPLRA